METDRRDFIKTAAVTGAGVACGALPSWAAENAASRRRNIKLGFDNFSLRAWGWKADQFLQYAATQKLDVMLFSDLKVYESHEEGYLRQLRAKADRLGLEIHVGTFSICPTSKFVTRDYGTPEEHLTLALRIARTLGSPVVRCVLGKSADREIDGGIERQIENTVKVLRNVRSRALDAGVKIAVENHSGDMQAWELAALVEAAGKEFVGATMDSGNAARTLEDPLVNLEILGPHVLTTNIRDTAVWEIAPGAQVQWVTMGKGNVDWKVYLDRFEACRWYWRSSPNTVGSCPISTMVSGSRTPKSVPASSPASWRLPSGARRRRGSRRRRARIPSSTRRSSKKTNWSAVSSIAGKCCDWG